MEWGGGRGRADIREGGETGEAEGEGKEGQGGKEMNSGKCSTPQF